MLDALVLQDNDGSNSKTLDGEQNNQMSSSLWDTLRTICHHLKRPDLAVLCDKKDLEGDG